MTDSIEEIRLRVAAFDRVIGGVENDLDAAARILEDARIERLKLAQKLERLMLEEAVEFPGVIYG